MLDGDISGSYSSVHGIWIMLVTACIECLMKNPALSIFSVDHSDWRGNETAVDMSFVKVIYQFSKL